MASGPEVVPTKAPPSPIVDSRKILDVHARHHGILPSQGEIVTFDDANNGRYVLPVETLGTSAQPDPMRLPTSYLEDFCRRKRSIWLALVSTAVPAAMNVSFV